MEKKEIIIPIVFGVKSDEILLPGNSFIKFILEEDTLTVRQYYEYNGFIDKEDKSLGREDKIINEKAVFKKDAFHAFGCAYSNEMGCYYVTMQGNTGLDNFSNVETADKANELLSILVDWWLK